MILIEAPEKSGLFLFTDFKFAAVAAKSDILL